MMREALVAILLLTMSLAGCIGGLEDPLSEQSEPTDTEEVATEDSEFSDTHVFEGDYETEEPYGLTLEQGPFDVLEQQALFLDSPVDDNEIEIGFVRPDVPEDQNVPIIVFASPYLYPLHTQDLEDTRPRLTDNFVEHGYAVAFVAVRGTADSGGCSDLMGDQERADLNHAINWLGEQDWSNGNVGMIGVSYDGSTPWEVAAEGNEHLKTIVPISGVNDVYHLMYYNGTPEQRGALLLNALYYGWFAFSLPDRSPANTAEAAVCPQAYEGFAASMDSTFTGERDQLDYWEERNSRPGVEANYEGSIFLVHGLQDWNVDPHHALPWVPQLDDDGLMVKYWLGQWGHAWPDGDYLDEPIRRVDFAEVLLRWFDHELKGEEDTNIGPKIQVQDHTGQWRSADAWPPEDAQEKTFYLAPGGELTPKDDTSEGTVMVGPAPGSMQYGAPSNCLIVTCMDEFEPITCGGCVSFTSEAFEQRAHVAGLPPLHVDVTPHGASGHLSAFLYVLDEGEHQRIGWTQMDLRFADGDETAEPIVPGERITAKMQMQPLDAIVPQDAKLHLVIEQGAQADHQPTQPPAPVDLHVGADASPLTLETFTVDEDRYFEPPGE